MSGLIIDDNLKTVNVIRDISDELYKNKFRKVSENIDEALDSIFKYKISLVMLNLDTVKISIPDFFLELYQCLENIPNVIALSSTKAKAYEAYKYNCSDFILKPLTNLSVRKSLQKQYKKDNLARKQTICLKSYKDFHYLNINDILFLKADNNTTDFYMADGSVVSAFKTLKLFEQQMPDSFLRIHKSYVVNKNYISRIQYGKSQCIVGNEHTIPFTKTFVSNIDLINKTLSANTLSLN